MLTPRPATPMFRTVGAPMNCPLPSRISFLRKVEMTGLTALWLPIVLSAVVVFVVSSIIQRT